MLSSALFGSHGASCDVHSLYEKVQAEPCLLIDVREPAEFRGGHIPGAVNVPLGQVESAAARYGKTEPIHVICASGGRSLTAQKMLRSLGFEQVVNVEGGFRAWAAAGLPSSRRFC